MELTFIASGLNCRLYLLLYSVYRPLINLVDLVVGSGYRLSKTLQAAGYE